MLVMRVFSVYRPDGEAVLLCLAAVCRVAVPAEEKAYSPFHDLEEVEPPIPPLPLPTRHRTYLLYESINNTKV